MKIIDAFIVEESSQWAFVGAGGKTSLIFSIAQQYNQTIIITTTTHLLLTQAQIGNHHWIMNDKFKFPESISTGIVVVSAGDNGEGKVNGLSEIQISRLSDWAKQRKIPLLIEADGSRSKPLKAPAEYEPVIPQFVNRVFVLAGMRGLNRKLESENFHRPEIFAELSGIKVGEKVTVNVIMKVLTHPRGGLKNFPRDIEKTLVLTQIDNQSHLSAAKQISQDVLNFYDQVILTNDADNPEAIISIQSIAGVILAAGESSRLGRAKQFLDWRGKPFVQVVAENAIIAGLSPIIVVTGEDHHKIIDLLAHLPVKVVRNPNWREGQGTSVATGVNNIDDNVGGAIFLLVDQPQIEPPIIETLIAEHATSTAKIVAPLIDNQRGNPVLFDKVVFPELSTLKGEKGGRQLFSKFKVKWVSWVDGGALLDVDNESDYQRLLSWYK